MNLYKATMPVGSKYPLGSKYIVTDEDLLHIVDNEVDDKARRVLNIIVKDFVRDFLDNDFDTEADFPNDRRLEIKLVSTSVRILS